MSITVSGDSLLNNTFSLNSCFKFTLALCLCDSSTLRKDLSLSVYSPSFIGHNASRSQPVMSRIKILLVCAVSILTGSDHIEKIPSDVTLQVSGVLFSFALDLPQMASILNVVIMSIKKI